MSLLIEETIAELTNNAKQLLNSRLTNLSNLRSEELGLFEQAWAGIETKRRRQIIQRLVKLAEDNFELNFDSIFRSCLKNQDAEVRCKAIDGLWESEEPSLINLLINLLEQDSSEKVQAAAATTLGKFTMLAEVNKLRSYHISKVERALLGIINDDNKPIEVRRRALEAAAPLSLPEIKRAIMIAYQSHNPRLRISSIYAMGKNCDRSWLPILLKELANADAEIRYEAVGACGELGEAEAVSHIMELVNDPDINVQLAAIQTLDKIGGTETKECLEHCLNNPSDVIRQAAEQALHGLEVTEDPLSFRVS